MGFLFDMLEKAEGKNCQATNFLKSFSIIPQANRLGLLEESAQANLLTDMMQAACRFMLSQAAEEFRSIAPSNQLFESAVAVDALSSIRCVHCHNETIRPGGSYLTDLVYLPVSASNRMRHQIPTFSQILKASVELQTQTRGWCDKCRRYQQLATRKSVRHIPEVLVINAALKSAEARQYWTIPGWLPTSIGIFLDNGKFFCFEGEDLRLHLQKGMHVIKVYDLVGFVADVNSSEKQKSHLVSLINVSLSEREVTTENDWHLFNDFLVCQVPQEEALKFSSSWKLPSVLAFQASTARNQVDDSWKNNLDTSLLYRPFSINNKPPESCQILDATTEAPTKGTLIAIDTEFVALQQAEIEVRADGNREIVRPTRLGLARVSVVRGSGKEENLPFINDYITIHEEIVDYVTDFSGVAEGDLDPSVSTHPLVSLKLAYKKLWLLLNLGCVFVGHGLAKDFRTINIHVPKAQTIDTVDYFFKPGQPRKLSLRFLVWYFLKDKVQTGNHDSIEDAQSALRLWRKYEEFQDAGLVDTMVEEVYDEGRKWGYKPPWEAAAKKPARRPDLRSTDSMPGGNGRETPDLLITGSGPGTPSGKKAGLGRGSEYFDSPLR
jgi:PAB-dependent poly(A)-specific ribonuclease subunit 2